MSFTKETSYDSTPIGDVPSDWKVVTLERVTTSHKQGFYTSDSYSEKGVRLARITDLLDPKMCYETMPFLDIDNSTYEQFKVAIGDFLFARSGAIGRHGIVTEDIPCIFAAYIIRFRFEETLVNNYFLSYLFQADFVKNQFLSKMHGATNININAENIKSIRIPLPSLHEQLAIVGVLDVVNSALELADRVIAKTVRLKNGLMQQLLTHGIGHSEYKQTPIEKIPKEWEEVSLGEVCEQRNEMFQPTETGSYTFVGLEHIGPGETKVRNYAKDASLKSSKFKFYSGDLLYGKLRPYLDKAALVDFGGICSTDLLVLKNKKEISKEFLAYILHSKEFLDHAIATTSGTNHPRTSWKMISKFKFALPTMPEQQRIADTLLTMDKKLRVEGQEKAKLEIIKRGLMDLLLTGKVRIKVD
jgi:type I restriction enzyme, S subunit